MTLGREASPLLRDHGMLFWLFDHLALRATLYERNTDAALIAGYAGAAHQEFGRTREGMGRHAAERTAGLLRDRLSGEKIAELHRLGAQLSEDQVTSIALSR